MQQMRSADVTVLLLRSCAWLRPQHAGTRMTHSNTAYFITYLAEEVFFAADVFFAAEVPAIQNRKKQVQ